MIRIDGIGEFELINYIESPNEMGCTSNFKFEIAMKSQVYINELKELFNNSSYAAISFDKENGSTVEFCGLLKMYSQGLSDIGSKVITLEVSKLVQSTHKETQPEEQLHYARIVSDGSPSGTRIFFGDRELSGVTDVKINAETSELVEATIKLTNVKMGGEWC